MTMFVGSLFTAFLEQPLTDYLREIASERTDEALNEIGNFHFSFIVDNKVAYTENLNLGAILPVIPPTLTLEENSYD